MPKINQGLSAKERRFVGEYLIDLDPKRAALSADYSKSVAASKAYQWVSNCKVKPHVFEAIKAGLKAKMAELKVTAEDVAAELALLGFADMGTYIKLGAGDTTVSLDWTDLPEGATRCIQEITQEEHTGGKGHEKGQIRRTKFKLYDKKGSLELLGRHLGMFNDKLALGVDSDLMKLMGRIDGKSRGLSNEGRK